MAKKLLIVSVIAIFITINIGPLHAKNRVDADPDTYEGWYDDRDIEDAPAQVQYGYELIVHTPVTLGPEGYVKGADGNPIVYSTLSCSSCHFDGGRVVEGIPFFQVRDKYAPPGKFWRPKNRVRQIEERINWCLVNCANGQMLEEDSPEMQAMVAYMNWLADGITDPSMKGPENWQNIPGHTWPSLPEDFLEMSADPELGEEIYYNRCDRCHGEQGAGRGEYRRGEEKARVPALWSSRSYTKGAFGMHAVPNVTRMIARWMPLGDADLTLQEAMDVAGFINTKTRPMGPATQTFFDGADPATGMPNYLLKPAYWAIGAPIPDDPFPYEQRLLGPWVNIDEWQATQRQAWLDNAQP